MEDWQKDHIIRNMPELIETTTCSRSLLQCLKTKPLSDGEYGTLIDTLSNPTAAVQKLFRILMSHEGAYDTLKQALFDTQQDLSYKILSKATSNEIKSSFEKYDTITFDKNDELGRGCYGTKVHRGRFKNRDVAVKIISLDYIDIKQVMDEIELIQNLKHHANIVKFLGYVEKPGYVYIALELCSINLKDWIKSKIPSITATSIIYQATNGIYHLHSHKIVHNDLKPVNILLNSYDDKENTVVVKITDFGISRKFADEQQSVSLHSLEMGTEGWMAPEVLLKSKMGLETSAEHTFAADIFALGCIYYYTLTDGYHPFGDSLRRQGNIVDNNHHINDYQREKIPDDLYVLILEMVSYSPTDRPPISTILLERMQTYSNVNEPDDQDAAQEVQAYKRQTDTKLRPLNSIIICAFYRYCGKTSQQELHRFWLKSFNHWYFKVNIKGIYSFLNQEDKNIFIVKSIDFNLTIKHILDTISEPIKIINASSNFVVGSLKENESDSESEGKSQNCDKVHVTLFVTDWLSLELLERFKGFEDKYIFVTFGSDENIGVSLVTENLKWSDLSDGYQNFLAHKILSSTRGNDVDDGGQFVLNYGIKHQEIFSRVLKEEKLIELITTDDYNDLMMELVKVFVEDRLDQIFKDSQAKKEIMLNNLMLLTHRNIQNPYMRFYTQKYNIELLEKLVELGLLKMNTLQGKKLFEFKYNCFRKCVQAYLMSRE